MIGVIHGRLISPQEQDRLQTLIADRTERIDLITRYINGTTTTAERKRLTDLLCWPFSRHSARDVEDLTRFVVQYNDEINEARHRLSKGGIR